MDNNVCSKNVNGRKINSMSGKKKQVSNTGAKIFRLIGRNFVAEQTYMSQTYDLDYLIFNTIIHQLSSEVDSDRDTASENKVYETNIAKTISGVNAFATGFSGDMMIFFKKEFCYFDLFNEVGSSFFSLCEQRLQ